MKKLIVLFLCFTLTIPFCLATCDTEPMIGDVSKEISNNDLIDALGEHSSDYSSEISCETSSPDIDITGHYGYNTETNTYYLNMPDNPAPEKKEFKVLVYDNTIQTTYFSEEIGYDKYLSTDDNLNNAVRLRNEKIQQDYGVEIKAIYAADVYTDLLNDILAGLCVYDAAMPFMSSCARLAQKGGLHNLADEKFEDYIDLSAPWWDKNATKSMSIDDKVYFTTGDISIMHKQVSAVITFNKNIMRNNYEDVNLYDLVKNGTWTFDKMMELSKGVTKNSNGDKYFDYKDTWGLVSSYADPAVFYLASDEHLIEKDSNDLPVIAIGNERSISVAQSILSKMQDTNKWCIHANDIKTKDMWNTSLEIFAENRALFRTSTLATIKKLRNYSEIDDFGIIPLPKFEEIQESYYAPCAASMAYGIVIPVSAQNSEFSAFMIEVMACEAKNYISRSYYEGLIRDIKDVESEDMLDIIFNNIVYDQGMVYDFDGVSSMYFRMMFDKRSDIISELEMRKESIKSSIDNTINELQR